MRQSAAGPLRLIPWLLLAMVVAGCGDRGAAPRAAEPRPRVASLVPAATDLIIGMGAGDHLVAISNYDVDRPGTAGLPRVGDYRALDWERLAFLQPDILIVFMAADRMPPGLQQRAESLQIQLVNVRTERLEDVFSEIKRLGELLGEKDKAASAAKRLRSELAAVQERVRGRTPVRTLIVREAAADGVVGCDNFVNDVLEIAGGQNVVTTSGWPSIDREMLLSLRPDAIVQLLPDASPQVIQQAKHVWTTMPPVPAVASGRVHLMTEWWAVQPGMQLAQLAERLSRLLHPDAWSSGAEGAT